MLELWKFLTELFLTFYVYLVIKLMKFSIYEI